MAKMSRGFIGTGNAVKQKFKKKTRIGKSVFSRPKTKSDRRQWKKYRGQGR
jgi:hypothetical protein